jgi:hypothetical protein
MLPNSAAGRSQVGIVVDLPHVEDVVALIGDRAAKGLGRGEELRLGIGGSEFPKPK